VQLPLKQSSSQRTHQAIKPARFRGSLAIISRASSVMQAAV
jgi:hypothetical protein